MEWEAPRSDGGNKITSYIIERKPAGSEFWVKTATVDGTKCQIDELIENAEYEFRVKAVNKAGESVPSISTGRIKVTEYPSKLKL